MSLAADIAARMLARAGQRPAGAGVTAKPRPAAPAAPAAAAVPQRRVDQAPNPPLGVVHPPPAARESKPAIRETIGPVPESAPRRARAEPKASAPRPRVFVDVLRNQVPRPPALSHAVVLPELPAAAAAPLPPPLPNAGRWKGSCPERCGDSGRKCALPAPHPGQPHGDKRGPFARLAVAGQTHFVERERVELAAVSASSFRDPNGVQSGASGGKVITLQKREAKRARSEVMQVNTGGGGQSSPPGPATTIDSSSSSARTASAETTQDNQEVNRVGEELQDVRQGGALEERRDAGRVLQVPEGGGAGDDVDQVLAAFGDVGAAGVD